MKRKLGKEELSEFKGGKYMGGPKEEAAEKRKKKTKRMAAGGEARLDERRAAREADRAARRSRRGRDGLPGASTPDVTTQPVPDKGMGHHPEGADRAARRAAHVANRGAGNASGAQQGMSIGSLLGMGLGIGGWDQGKLDLVRKYSNKFLPSEDDTPASNAASNVTSTTTPTTPAAPVMPEVRNWRDTISHHFKTPTVAPTTMKAGGLVRGGGAAVRGVRKHRFV